MKKQFIKGISLALAIGITLGVSKTAYASTNEKLLNQGYSYQVSANDLDEYEKVKRDFINLYGKDKFYSTLNENVNKDDRGAVTITAKILKKILKEKGAQIVAKLKKVPIVGNAVGNFLEKNLNPLISFMDKVEAGVEGAIKTFLMSKGVSESTAEIWADVIITVVSLFL